MATSKEEWESGMQNGIPAPGAQPETDEPGRRPGAGSPGAPGAPGSLRPGRPPGPKPNKPGAPRPGRPQRPDPSDSPESDPAKATRLTRFEGMHLKLRKTSKGRYALGVDLELGFDGKPGTTPEDVEDLPDEGEGKGEAEAFAADGDAGMFAAEDEGDDEGEGMFATDDDEEAFAAEDDSDDAFAGDDEDDASFAAEDEGDGAGAATFATDEEGAEDDTRAAAAGVQWPNRFPVPKGVLEVSQAPALFDDPDDDEDEGDGKPTAQLRSATARPMAAAPAPGAPRPAPRPGAPRPARPVGTVKGMLAAARKTLGMGERPPGSDHNKITEWYNKHIARIGNGPWCNMAVTYWAGHSRNLRAIFAGKGIGYAYTVAHARKFHQKGRWHAGVAGIRPGDIVFFDWNRSRSIQNIDHIGVVERVSGKKIITIEGNTTGDRCKRQVRDARYIVGYGRPAYGR